MLKINNLEIRVLTTENNLVMGLSSTFNDGLNLITSNNKNTSGKSTVISTILYCLGMEEIIGGKGYKVLSTGLTNIIWDENRTEYKVIGSNIYLEITNGKNPITIYRTTNDMNRDSSLITVYYSTLKNISEKETKSEDMYVHSPNSAKNKRGFFTFLESYLDLKLPDVPSYKGANVKLYLQNIFAAMVIEQKRGWGDILVRVPNYSIIEPKKRTIEYILNLDALSIEKNKADIKIKKEKLISEWEKLFIELKSQVFPFNIIGLNSSPILIEEDMINKRMIKLTSSDENKEDIPAEEFINTLKEKLSELSRSMVKKNNDEEEGLKFELEEVDIQLNKLGQFERELIQKREMNKAEINKFQKNYNLLLEDIQNNKDAKKLQSLGSKEKIMSFDSQCPVCNQSIQDSLLVNQQYSKVMSLDDNITHLNDQAKLFSSMIQQRQEQKIHLDKQSKEISGAKSNLMSLKKALLNDIYSLTGAYSETNILKRMKLEGEINSSEEKVNLLQDIIPTFVQLSSKWKKIIEAEQKVPKTRLSDNDKKKLKFLKEKFTKNLTDFNYRSVSDVKEINISETTYMPEISSYDLKYDSSASDNARAIWAFTLALLETSNKFNGNHPGLIIFDEPIQHSIIADDMEALFKKMTQLENEAQIIVGFTREEGKIPEKMMEDIDSGIYNIINLGELAFKKLSIQD
ncbi:hypothetical protein [Bacillus thuringiensis]|uniref:Rad50/SbcC-type AAA domain-containing protein n=1 Tax=Bacillus thuringiensis serovar toumanoffi TaxID=180862 RepID=A0ABD5I6R1_BACTU|nr:hypothetical protein [Bacillus thuringiensis]MCR6782674.1 hypothetical protein [Bacillus thuringiensis]MCR6860745.1 hypothetical protein [Bacillus thuringiensis]MCR6864035.1 hypothetical protein [Bacillus thuringiensis]MDW9212796.1 hypothetical protein [Bacillus thuringiensis serovar toumanoffi]MED2621197.1 hypothetical protein [Bacillus thuringiensis]